MYMYMYTGAVRDALCSHACHKVGINLKRLRSDAPHGVLTLLVGDRSDVTSGGEGRQITRVSPGASG
jgi:hypothetical protein